MLMIDDSKLFCQRVEGTTIEAFARRHCEFALEAFGVGLKQIVGPVAAQVERDDVVDQQRNSSPECALHGLAHKLLWH